MPPSITGGVSVMMEADSNNWEARLKIKPIRTHFKANGSYYSEYANLKDSIIRKVTGTWALKADSIIMTQLTPDKTVTRLHMAIADNVATFSGMIYFIGSGKANDSYLGRQRKFK